YYPIFIKLFGPYDLEKSRPSHAIRFKNYPSVSGDTTTGEITIGETAIHERDFIKELEIRIKNNGGGGRAVLARLVAEMEAYSWDDEQATGTDGNYSSSAVAPIRNLEFSQTNPEEIVPEQPTSAVIIPFPSRKPDHDKSPNFAAAVREACAVFAKTGRLLDAALAYAKHDIPVFPCDPETKRPIPPRDLDPTTNKRIPGTGGFKKATCDPIIITRWWKKNPHALIAVPMGPRSGAWCPDIDTAVEHKVEGVTPWNMLIAQHEPFETREHRSASGGPHVFFKWQNELPIGCSAGNLPPGISVKGAGGYVAVPPSVRKGKSYTVFRDIDPIIAPTW